MKKAIITAALVIAPPIGAAAAAIVAAFLFLHAMEDTPPPVPYDPPTDAAARVRAFIHGDADHVNEADLNSPTVSPALRRAAINLNN